MSDSIQLLESWFAKNGLEMNRKKTEIISFQPIQNTTYLRNDIEIDNDKFELSDCTKFLGVYIDSNFRFCQHINYLRKKLSSVIFAINELKFVLDEKALKMVYYANFHSLISYGGIFWVDTINSKKFFVLQKKALRLMLKLHYLEHCKKYFKMHDILPLP